MDADKARKIWLILMVGVVALGVIGGIQTDASMSEWLAFAGTCIIVWYVGMGVIRVWKS